jgi:hypothetical protein
MSSLSKLRPATPQEIHSEVSDFHFGKSSPKLRPDNVGSVSHIRRATPERSSVGSDKMNIMRTREWNVREDFEGERVGRGDSASPSEERESPSRSGEHYAV